MRLIIVSILLLLLPGVGNAETYKWTDQKGVMHFTDDPGKIPLKYRKKAMANLDGELKEPKPATNSAATTAPPQNKASFPPHPASPPIVYKGCTPGVTYTRVEYLLLKEKYEQLEKTCRPIIEKRNSIEASRGGRTIYIKRPAIGTKERSHLDEYEQKQNQEINQLYIAIERCVKERNAAQRQADDYYRCARNVGGLDLHD